MTYRLMESDDGSFYYLLSVDADNNQTLIIEGTLDEVRQNPHAKGLSVTKEAHTRETIKDPNAQVTGE